MTYEELRGLNDVLQILIDDLDFEAQEVLGGVNEEQDSLLNLRYETLKDADDYLPFIYRLLVSDMSDLSPGDKRMNILAHRNMDTELARLLAEVIGDELLDSEDEENQVDEETGAETEASEVPATEGGAYAKV